jgi:hypothetical protein
MSINTTLLGLNQPTTGGDSGIWGDEVNNGFTSIVDISVAGTNNLTADSNITLVVTNGTNTTSFSATGTNSTVAQYYVLNCSGSRSTTKTIFVPATSKTYIVINGTTGGQSINVQKTGGSTGVSIANGETAIVYYNSTTSDVVKVTTNTNTSGTSILYGNGSGGFSNVTVSTGLSFSGGTLSSTGVTSVAGTGSVNGLSLSGTVTTTGNITLSGAVTSLTTTNFTVQESGGKLVIKYGGTTVLSIDSGGNLVSSANVTAYGTP